jgi:hypothetical protein
MEDSDLQAFAMCLIRNTDTAAIISSVIEVCHI